MSLQQISKRAIDETQVMQADPYSGVQLAVYHVKRAPISWRRGKITFDYEVRWRPMGEEDWNVRSTHKTVSAAIKEMARLRNASHGLTFKKR